MALTLPNRQRFGTIQHIVREDLENTAEMGDEVTSLCGDVTYRIRRKDDPNMLVCGMCALLMVREYRTLLKDYGRLAGLSETMLTELQGLQEQIEAQSEDDGDDGDEFDPDQGDITEDYTPDVDDDTIASAPRGMEDVPLPEEPTERGEG